MDYNYNDCYRSKDPDYLSKCVQKVDDETLQNWLDSPMPWIGMYIAAASAGCSLAMAVDAINGFRLKKLWFPCKYFPLNAFSMTVLAVAMKLPVDLTSNTMGKNDKIAHISSLVLMSTAMGNFMTSLGSMENNEIVLNVAALGVLVVTIAANVCIHNFEMNGFVADYTGGLSEEIVSIVLMLILLLTLCSSAVTVPSAKRYIESKYKEMHKRVSNKQVEWEKFTIDELRIMVKWYWVMAATGSPQFVMARSAISGASGLMCLLMVLTLIEVHVRMRLAYNYHDESSYVETSSNYKWSINWILYIQSIGVALGIIAPLFRWYVAASFKFSETSQIRLRDGFKIENYWMSRLVECRESSLPLQIQHYKCRKLLHDAKRLVLNLFIRVQILFVLARKLVLLISAKFGIEILMCLHNIKNLKRVDSRASNDMNGLELQPDKELDIKRCVLLLEGEAELPEKILKNMCNEEDTDR